MKGNRMLTGQNLLKIAFTAFVYFALARASLLLQFEYSNATPVWPPAGFAFAVILLWGMRIVPGILAGAFAANFMIFMDNQTVAYGSAAALSLIIAAGNTSSALAGKFLLTKFYPAFKTSTYFDKVEDVLKFSLIAALMCLVSSSVGTMTVSVADIISRLQVPTVWLTWWLGDFSGILLITSFLLIWKKIMPLDLRLSENNLRVRREVIVFYLTVFLSGGVIFNNWLIERSLLNSAYWIIPVLVWAALRFSQRELITSLVFYSLAAIWGAVNNHGPFGNQTLNEALLSLQAFIAIMVVTKMTLHASVIEQKNIEVKLRKTGDELDTRVKLRTAQLEERSQFAETILNSSFDSIAVLDTELRCISINKKAKSQLMIPFPENVIGKKLTELPSFMLPEEIKEDIHKALAGETIHRERFASPVSDKYYEIDYIPLNNNDGIHAVMLVAHDITHRVHAELEIREQKAFAEMLIEYSPYMVMAYNKNLIITAWNKKSEEHTGLSREQVVGKHTHDVFPEYNDPKWNAMIQEVLNKGKSFHFPKIRFLHKPGWGESFVTPLYRSNNEVIGLLSITRDITDLVDMTSSLEQKNRELLKTNEELSSFAYVASHDLQEPLRKIRMFSNRILETDYDILPEHSKNYFDRMRRAAERMQLLIEDLLTYSRTGSLTRDFESIDLGSIVREVKENLKDEIQQKNANIIMNGMVKCKVIPFQFRQLIHNLITNSLKFSKAGVPPEIKITSRFEDGSKLDNPKLEQENKYCHITVSDNGIGFDPEFNEQIFGLFQRLHGKHEFPGTGIGLSICKKIIENHGGVITARGNPGIGATFEIFLPHVDD